MVVTQEDDRWPTEQSDKDTGGHICRKTQLNMSGAAKNVSYLPWPYTSPRFSSIPYLVPGRSLSGGWTWLDHYLAQLETDNG